MCERSEFEQITIILRFLCSYKSEGLNSFKKKLYLLYRGYYINFSNMNTENDTVFYDLRMYEYIGAWKASDPFLKIGFFVFKVNSPS